MRVSHVVPFVFLVGLGALNSAAAATYTSQELGPTNGRQYIDLNNNQYALTMRQDAPGLANLHIVIENWNPGYYGEVRPGTLPGTTRSIALDFNDSQAVVGYAETLDANGVKTAPERAFVYSNGVLTDLSALPPLNGSGILDSRAVGINNAGDVVGSWLDSTGLHWYIYSGGVITEQAALIGSTVTAINEAKQLTGTWRPSPSQPPHAFTYSQGSAQDIDVIPTGLGSGGEKINASGEISGSAKPGTHSRSCFNYLNGVVKTWALPSPGEPSCTTSAINNSGAIVGQSFGNPTPPLLLYQVGFIHSNDQTMDLNTLINPTDYLAVNHVGIINAFAINDSGYIVVQGGAKYYLLKPDGATPPTDSAYYHFESTTHDWFSEGDPIVALSSSTAQKFAGAASLAVQFNGSGYVSLDAMYPPPLAGKTVTFHVYLPADATIEWVQPYVLEDYAGNWAWHGNWQPVGDLQLGAWNTITVDVPAEAQAAYRLGVELYTSQTYGGTVYVDSVSF